MSWIADTLEEFKDQPLIIKDEGRITYGDVLAAVTGWQKRFKELGLKKGDCVAIIDDNSEATVFLVLALLANRNIVLLPMEDNERTAKNLEIAYVNGFFQPKDGDFVYERRAEEKSHLLLDTLRDSDEAGLIILTSGSTGDPKAAVHQFSKLVSKNSAKKKKSFRTLVFLKLDHIGGINTLLAIMAAGGSVVMIKDRTPATICQAIANHEVELLPTTPSFLNMLIMAQAHEKYDLSSLKMITYGTEPMHQSTLNSLAKIFPDLKLKQTYGATELGIFPTKSKGNGSRWMKVGGNGVETKIKDGTLHIRTKSVMLGYLNATANIDDEGWYNTNDKVEVDGDYLKILGRQEEIINVGGEKVYPAEIESVLLEMDNVEDVAVRGVKNPVVGAIVGATFVLENPEEKVDFNKRMIDFCLEKLDGHKIPRLIDFSDGTLMGSRFKKMRL